MKKPTICFLIVSAFLMCLCSCGAKTANVTQERYLRTGIDSKESVVFLLNSFMEHGEKNESEEKEKYLETCLRTALKDEKPRYQIVSSKDFRKGVFPGKKYEDTRVSSDAIIDLLRDDHVRSELEKIKVRYIVTVDIKTSNIDEQWEFAGKDILWGLGQSWKRFSQFDAYVLDTKNNSKSGSFQSSSIGPAGYFVPVILVIPLPPVPWFAMTENEACQALGRAVHNFLVSKEEHSPAYKPVTK